MSTSPTVRVAHVVSHPIQYFAPLYRELSDRRELDLSVIYYRRSDEGPYFDRGFDSEITWGQPLLEGYSWESVVGGGQLRVLGRLLARLSRGQFDVVWVHGYAHAAGVVSALATIARRNPLLVREEATLRGHRVISRTAVKEIVLRTLYGRAGGLWIGEESRAFFERYGFSEARLFRARYSVDNAHFQQRESVLSPQRDEIRRKFGIRDSTPVVLYVGKLEVGKNVHGLIRAVLSILVHRPCWLLVVGAGSARERLESMAAEHADRIRFLGFLDQERLPEAYVASDIFCLPSLAETWGLVVNEAMNFGLPVVVSDAVGCAPDLVLEGSNGYAVPSGDNAALAAALTRLIDSPFLRGQMGAVSRELIDDFSISHCADDIVAACLAVARKNAQ